MTGRSARLLTFLLAISLAAMPGAVAQQRPQRPPVAGSAPASPHVAQPAPAETPGPVYEPRLLRLAEIMGALTYMGELCQSPPRAAPSEAEAWRGRMRELMEAEGQSPLMKERLAGAFNRGVTGYQASYRACTPAGRLAVERLLNEGAMLAHDLAGRYGS